LLPKQPWLFKAQRTVTRPVRTRANYEDIVNTATLITPILSWRPPRRSLDFQPENIQVWRAWLDQPPSQIEKLLETLSPDERDRAARFYFQKDRDHYIVGRGTLRMILGRYLNIEPEALRFNYSAYGKPSLTREFGGDFVRFNLSHSYGLALFAVSRGCDVGIDLELIKSDFATMAIAEKFFSPREVSVLLRLSPHYRTQAFFNCWTRKEAYVKARGEGLSLALDKFDVSLAPGDPAALLYAEGDPQAAKVWALKELTLDGGYVGALAVRVQGEQNPALICH
jgi:4'-phosphopantetheinyl transferase